MRKRYYFYIILILLTLIPPEAIIDWNMTVFEEFVVWILFSMNTLLFILIMEYVFFRNKA